MADVDVAENKNVLFQQYEIKIQIYEFLYRIFIRENKVKQ